MKRTFVAMATGISFGLFAGLGIYIVTMVTGNSTGFGLFTSKYASIVFLLKQIHYLCIIH